MITCQFCDQRNAPGRKHCEKCGAELPFDPTATPSTPGPPATGLEREVVDLVRTGGIIAAIKHYREATGAGLKESKDAVERIAAGHGIERPKAAGCATVIVACIAGISLAISACVAGAGRWPRSFGH